MRVQLLFLELIRDNFHIRELMLASKPLEIFHIMGPRESIPQDKVTITDWMLLLALEESLTRPS